MEVYEAIEVSSLKYETLMQNNCVKSTVLKHGLLKLGNALTFSSNLLSQQ